MFYDALTTAAVCDELRQNILGGLVQRVLRLSEHSLGLEVYAKHERHWLLISAHPQNARVHLAPERLARASEDVTPLLLLLRKHVRDGRIVAVAQPPFERILTLTISKRSEDPAEGLEQFRLIIEIMGRYSNVILTDEGNIVLDALRRISAQINRYRVVLPHHPYVPPPPQQKTPPDQLTAAVFEQALMALPPATPLWQALVSLVKGMSPLLAREIVFRAAGNAAQAVGAASFQDGELERVLHITQELYQPLADHSWSPSVVRGPSHASQSDADAPPAVSSAQTPSRVVSFAPYNLTHRGPSQPCDSISAAVDAYYAELERFSSTEQQKAVVRVQIEEARQRHVRRQEALRRSLAQGQEAERLRANGEAILAALGNIRPRQTELAVEGAKVALDPALTAVENAQAYFREYKKAKGALQRVPDMLAEEEAALSYFDQVAAHLELAATNDDVRRIIADLPGSEPTKATKQPKKQKQAKHRRPAKAGRPAPRLGPPPHRILPGGYEIYVGHSAHQNEEITFHTAGPEDLWLHARGVPGAHVVVRAGGREVPEAVVETAAALAAGFSQARGSGRVAVDVTRRKHVRRARIGFPGLVNYSDERTLQVTPAT